MEKRTKISIFLGILLALTAVLALLPQKMPANLTETEQKVWQYAQENGISFSRYPESILALLERNPETETFVLEYPLKKNAPVDVDMSEFENCGSVPLFLQWDPRWGYIEYGSDVAGLTGCGPVCLSMVAWYYTEDTQFSPDKILAFALENGYYSKGNGSSWTLISEGGKKLGFYVTELPLDKNRILKNLEVGNPIICAMGPGAFTTSGHYIVMTGTENGMIRVNDPNSRANSEKLWTYEEVAGQIRNLWSIRETA